MAINIITGRPGSGKTYILANLGMKFLQQGKKVYANFKLNYEGKNLIYWTKPSELTKIEQGIILMDEAQIYFNSRKWEDLDEQLQYKLQQHRKDGLDIWGTTQHEARIDVLMRELVSSFFVCKKIFGSKEGAKKPWGLILMSHYYPEEMKSIKKSNSFFDIDFIWIQKKVCNFYNTKEKIRPEEKPTLTHHEKFCPTCNAIKTTHT